MFDTTTILTLIAPVVLAILAGRMLLHVIAQREASRRGAAVPVAKPAPIVLDSPAPAAKIVLDPAAAALAPDHMRERNVA